MTRRRASEDPRGSPKGVEALGRLLALAADDERLASAIHDVDVYQEELAMQRQQLLASQRLLEESRDRYWDLFTYAPVGYAIVDRNGLVLEMNAAAARLVGTEARFAQGVPFLIYVAATDRRRFLVHMHRCRTGDGSAVETQLLLKGRETGAVPVQLTTRRMTGTSTFSTAVVDLTDLKRAEDARIAAEREQQRSLRDEVAARAASDAKDRFLATLSHELRTPLTPILFALATLEARGVVPEALRFNLEMIRRNVQHEARLIDDLLDLTRIARDKVHLSLEDVDVHALLGDILTGFTDELRQGGLTVDAQLAARRHHVRGDATRLRQVFWNLVTNAVRYTPAPGRISVRSENPRARELRVSVIDSGQGIAPDMLARIFSPFEQADDPQGRRGRAGLGLGLAIAKGLVEAHGGRIGAASDGAGTGATFTVELLTVAESKVEAAPRLPARRVMTGQPTVLVVEDDRDSAAALEASLRLNGYQVRLARSVGEALREPADQIDVLVSDIGLPDGSGLDVMRRLRAVRPVRGIALSGYGSADDLRASREAGFDQHLVKPIDVEVLLRAIERVVACASAGSAG